MGASVNKSIFVGTWSFTEADVASREKVRPLMMNFGITLLAFWEELSGINNVEYLKHSLAHKLNKTHNLLVWQTDAGPMSWYFLAVDRRLGAIRCSTAVDCKRSTIHPQFRA